MTHETSDNENQHIEQWLTLYADGPGGAQLGVENLTFVEQALRRPDTADTFFAAYSHDVNAFLGSHSHTPVVVGNAMDLLSRNVVVALQALHSYEPLPRLGLHNPEQLSDFIVSVQRLRGIPEAPNDKEPLKQYFDGLITDFQVAMNSHEPFRNEAEVPAVTIGLVELNRQLFSSKESIAVVTRNHKLSYYAENLTAVHAALDRAE